MKLFGQLIRTAVNVALLPIAAVADVTTLGGTMNGKDQPYIVKAIERLKEEAEEEL